MLVAWQTKLWPTSQSTGGKARGSKGSSSEQARNCDAIAKASHALQL